MKFELTRSKFNDGGIKKYHLEQQGFKIEYQLDDGEEVAFIDIQTLNDLLQLAESTAKQLIVSLPRFDFEKNKRIEIYDDWRE